MSMSETDNIKRIIAINKSSNNIRLLIDSALIWNLVSCGPIRSCQMNDKIISNHSFY
jgi:hypothetical protein